MGREYRQLYLSKEMCAGLREVIRPPVDSSSTSTVLGFCRRLYLSYYAFESDPDIDHASFSANEEDLMIINHFVSSEDGDWAKDILQQTRQVLYELVTGEEAVQLAASKDMNTVLDVPVGKPPL